MFSWSECVVAMTLWWKELMQNMMFAALCTLQLHSPGGATAQ